MFWVSLVLIILLCAFYRLFIRSVYSYWKKHGIPSVPPEFPFGHLMSFFSKEHLAERLASFYHRYKKDGPIIGLYFFFEPIILVTDLNLVEDILIRDFHHFQRRTNIFHKSTDPLAANLFTIDYEPWKPVRKKLDPAFSAKSLRKMIPTIADVADDLLIQMKEFIRENGQNELEISDWMSRYTMDVVNTCLLGFNRRTLNNPNEELLKIGQRVFNRPRMTPHRNALIKQFESVLRLFGFRSHYKNVTDYFMRVVKNTVADRENNNFVRKDVLDILIKLKNSNDDASQLTIEEISAHAYVVFLAGFHASSATLMYCLHELSKDHQKHIQDKARAEAKATLEKYDGRLTFECMREMVYIEQVVLETLRKHPPDPEVTRTTTRAYKIPDTGFTIPVGMKVKIPTFGIHHDPEIYENFEDFIPERFSSEEMAKRHSCSFLTFGHGPRNCIAQQHALHQIQIGLIQLMANFEFSVYSRTDASLKYDGRKNVFRPNEVWLNVEIIE